MCDQHDNGVAESYRYICVLFTFSLQAYVPGVTWLQDGARVMPVHLWLSASAPEGDGAEIHKTDESNG